jgi:DNA-binding TFAR19-related protein (PDSD5 family)
MEMAGGGQINNGLTPQARERLERIAVEIIAIASECENDRATQQKLMQVADQISAILDE